MPATATNTALLQGLREPGDGAPWTEFVERYRPLLVAFGRRAGLQVQDAEDLAQEVLIAFAAAYRAGRYDRDRGRLRAWLFGIARTLLANARRRRGISGAWRADAGAGRLEEIAADGSRLEELWEEEWRGAVLAQCLREVSLEVQPVTLAAFRSFALAGRPAAEVAAELGLTENAVYGAKRRVLERVREILPLLDDQF
jgi:RNA polymerase sigma-70 factor (ECF subfamily)